MPSSSPLPREHNPNRLTKHQREYLMFMLAEHDRAYHSIQLSAHRTRWIRWGSAYGTVRHLAEKGYIKVSRVPGPRGGILHDIVPTPAAWELYRKLTAIKVE